MGSLAELVVLNLGSHELWNHWLDVAMCNNSRVQVLCIRVMASHETPSACALHAAAYA